MFKVDNKDTKTTSMTSFKSSLQKLNQEQYIGSVRRMLVNKMQT